MLYIYIQIRHLYLILLQYETVVNTFAVMKHKIFKAGKYPQGEVTAKDVMEIASSYDPAFHQAPLTLDHAQTGPAHGWVSSVSADASGNLFADFESVTDDIINLTRSGKYKKPSVEIASYDGKKYLRAVSLVNFPQVKGLPEIKFKDENSSIFFCEDLNISFKQKNSNQQTINTMNETAIKFFESLGIKTDNEVLAFDELSKKYNELKGKVKAIEAENIALKESAAEQVKKFAESKVDSLITAGKVLPANKDYLVKMALADSESFDKFAETLPVLPVMEQSKTGQKTPSVKDLKDPKFFKEDGKPVTYADIVKDPALQKNFSEEELAELRADYAAK